MRRIIIIIIIITIIIIIIIIIIINICLVVYQGEYQNSYSWQSVLVMIQ